MAPELDDARARAWRDEALDRAQALDDDLRWRNVHDEGGRIVALLKRNDGPDAIRGEATLHGDFDAIAHTLLLDRESHKSWDPSLTRFELLARLGDAHTLVHLDVRTGAHPVVRDRELVMHEATIRTAAGLETIAASRPFDEVPRFDGCVRAELLVAWRRLERHRDGTLRYRALWRTDLRGRLPRSLVTRGQVAAMRAELRKFSERWSAGG